MTDSGIFLLLISIIFYDIVGKSMDLGSDHYRRKAYCPLWNELSALRSLSIKEKRVAQERLKSKILRRLHSSWAKLLAYGRSMREDGKR